MISRRVRKNSDAVEFRFMRFSFDVPSDYEIEKIVVPSFLASAEKWAWEKNQLFTDGFLQGTVSLKQFSDLVTTAIYVKCKQNKFECSTVHLIEERSGYRVYSGSISNVIHSGRLINLGSISFIFRKKSPFNALFEGFAAKENPRKGFPESIEFPRLGTLMLPGDLEVYSIDFNFSQGRFVFNWEKGNFYYVDFADGLKRQYAKFDEIVRKIERKCLANFSQSDCTFTPWIRGSTYNFGSEPVRVDDSNLVFTEDDATSHSIVISVGGRPLSPLEILVRGAESNPNLKRHRQKTRKNPRKGFPESIELLGLGVIEFPAQLKIYKFEVSLFGDGYFIDYDEGYSEFTWSSSAPSISSKRSKQFQLLVDEMNKVIQNNLETYAMARRDWVRLSDSCWTLKIYEKMNIIGRLYVTGKPISALEAFVIGSEKNPKKSKNSPDTVEFRFLEFHFPIPSHLKLSSISMFSRHTSFHSWNAEENQFRLGYSPPRELNLRELENRMRKAFQQIKKKSDGFRFDGVSRVLSNESLYVSIPFSGILPNTGLNAPVGWIKFEFVPKSSLEGLVEGFEKSMLKNPRRNPKSGKFRFLGFSFDVSPANHKIEEIMVGSPLTYGNRWKWREDQTLTVGESAEQSPLSLGQFKVLLRKRIQDSKGHSSELRYYLNQSLPKDPDKIMFLGSVYERDAGNEIYLGSMTFIFRKKSSLEALTEGLKNPRRNPDDPENWTGETGICPLVPPDFMVKSYSLIFRPPWRTGLKNIDLTTNKWAEIQAAIKDCTMRLPPHPVTQGFTKMMAAKEKEYIASGNGPKGRLFEFGLKYWDMGMDGQPFTVGCGALMIGGRRISSLEALVSGFDDADST